MVKRSSFSLSSVEVCRHAKPNINAHIYAEVNRDHQYKAKHRFGTICMHTSEIPVTFTPPMLIVIHEHTSIMLQRIHPHLVHGFKLHVRVCEGSTKHMYNINNVPSTAETRHVLSSNGHCVLNIILSL